MLDLQELPRPKSNIIAIIPKDITFEFNLSDTLKDAFQSYIDVVLKDLSKRDIKFKKTANTSLDKIINSFKDPSGVMT